jgi:hypothetical protein
MYTAVAELIWVVIWGYIALAAVSFAVALLRPQGLFAKLCWASFVLVVFGYFPVTTTLESRRSKAALEAFRAQVKQSCASQSVTPLAEPVKSLHIASSALTSSVNLTNAYHYMLQRGLTTLELDASAEVVSSFSKFYKHGTLATPGATDTGKTIALSLMHRDDSACAMFYRWSKEYPAQDLPGLRKLGLRPEACIGASLLDAPSSQLSVAAKSRQIRVEQNPSLQAAEYTFTVTNRATGRVMASAVATFAPPKEKMRDACLSGEEQRSSSHQNRMTLDALVPERRPFAPETTTTKEPAEFPVQRKANADDILKSRAMRGAGRIWSTNIIDESGTTWIESNYSSKSGWLDGYNIVLMRGSRLYKTYIQVGETKIDDVTGLLVTHDEVRLVGMGRGRKFLWLFVYSASGSPLEALALNEEQFAQLSDRPAR